MDHKAKRNDLRQVGLALLVTTDFHIPLLHQVYPGDRPDSKQFAGITDALARRYQTLAQHCQDITLVFDKGNNSEGNLRRVEEGPFHFVGSLVPSQHADLLAISLEQFTPVQDARCAGVRAYRTTRKVLGVERIPEDKEPPQLTFEIDRSALRQLEDRSFGKTILFTNQHEWSTADIIGAYRGQVGIEEAFKRMKDPHFLSWSPVFHWTDQKILVHTFYCVLALTLSALLRRELHQHGIELSIPALLETLSGIHEVAVIYPSTEGHRHKDHMTLTERIPLQQRIMDVLKLDRV